MNAFVWELVFSKKASIFTFRRGSTPAVMDGMNGFKTWRDTFLYKDPETGKVIEKDRIWNDEEEVKD